MVQERGEPHLPIPGCCQTYPLQRTLRALLALSPGRVLLVQVPFGRSPSLRLLHHRLPDLVWRLHRYYGTVRLPVLVHRRRVSLDFATRPAAPSAAGEHRTSRFSCDVFPYVHGVSDRAGPDRISRYRCVRFCLPLSPTASASRSKFLSRLNTRPTRTAVNASALSLWKTAHDSGPSWVAGPSTCDSFIHNTSPVYPGAQVKTHEKAQRRGWRQRRDSPLHPLRDTPHAGLSPIGLCRCEVNSKSEYWNSLRATYLRFARPGGAAFRFNSACVGPAQRNTRTDGRCLASGGNRKEALTTPVLRTALPRGGGGLSYLRLDSFLLGQLS